MYAFHCTTVLRTKSCQVSHEVQKGLKLGDNGCTALKNRDNQANRVKIDNGGGDN